MSAVINIFHIFPGVVVSSPPGPPLLPSTCTTMFIIFHERLSSSLPLMCPYQFNLFCLSNVDIWHTLASSCMTWFLSWSFLDVPIIHPSNLISAIMIFVLVFLSDHPTLCSICHCWLDHCFRHLVFQLDEYRFVA